MTALTASFADRTVLRVGYGALQLERLHDRRDEAVQLLRHAVELGVDHVDTAEFYGFGFVNDVIREALRPEDGVLVVTKVGADPNPGGRLPLRLAQRPEQLRASVEDNLRSLGVDRLPVVNLRRLDTGPGLRPEGDQVVGLDDQLAVMTALRDEGKIGAIGLSSVTRRPAPRSAGGHRLRAERVQPRLPRRRGHAAALCGRGHRLGAVLPTRRGLPGLPKVTEEPVVHAVAESLGVAPSQVGLAWLLHHAPNVLLIPGTADAAHLEANLAADKITIDAETLATLDAIESRSNDVPIG